MAQSIGTDKFGVNEITNHCMIVTGDHIGTAHRLWGHVKTDGAARRRHSHRVFRYGDGVVLDLTHKAAGDEITVADIEEAGDKARRVHESRLSTVVLLRTDAAKKRFDKAYLTDHPGMTKEVSALRARPGREGNGDRRRSASTRLWPRCSSGKNSGRRIG